MNNYCPVIGVHIIRSLSSLGGLDVFQGISNKINLELSDPPLTTEIIPPGAVWWFGERLDFIQV